MSRDEPTRVEKLVTEKAELQEFLSQMETFRRNIRLGDTFEIEEPMTPRLRRVFFLGRGQLGDGVRKEISPEIVRQFYRFTHSKSDEAGARLNEINAELNARSEES